MSNTARQRLIIILIISGVIVGWILPLVAVVMVGYDFAVSGPLKREANTTAAQERCARVISVVDRTLLPRPSCKVFSYDMQSDVSCDIHAELKEGFDPHEVAVHIYELAARLEFDDTFTITLPSGPPLRAGVNAYLNVAALEEALRSQ